MIDKDLKIISKDYVRDVLNELTQRTSRIYFSRAAKIQDNLNNKIYSVKTGRLRSSIHTEVKQVGASIHGTIETNVEYAEVLEKGFKGNQNIKAHKRKMFGKQVSVRGHNRFVNRKGRSYFYSPLRDIEEELLNNLQEVMQVEFKK